MRDKPDTADMRQGPASPFLSVKEFSAFTGIHERTVRRLVDNGDVRALKVQRQIRIPESEIERLLGEGPDGA